MTSTSPWAVIGAIAASAGLLYMVGGSLWRKWLYKHPFSKGSYWLKGEEYSLNKPIKVCSGADEIYIELTPRVKYTISDVNLRFLLNADNTTTASVLSLGDKKSISNSDYYYQEDGEGGYEGWYSPHRVVSKNDVVKYDAMFSVSGSWQGELELSLRICTEEFGRYSIRLKCVWQPK